ncbi:MAG: dUTP diphosphatase [Clostridiales bacterium]|nr:dUTP diphosphatase [Clostridiales bacterium]MDD6389473.1 dUTP diphosphatase [Bacillota bacterium]MDY5975864.1 dUTP diphosphatase [Anaerovoracaceae bacterium]
MKIKIKSISGILPEYETEGSAGMDVRAYTEEDIVIKPGKRVLVPTGLFMEIPKGCEAQIRARSGLAIRNGITMINGIGTIDSDYRGEIKIPLVNLGDESFVIKNGDRIAQMVISRYETVSWEKVSEVGETIRGNGGFGHTGV